jgi:hypothetical protein
MLMFYVRAVLVAVLVMLEIRRDRKMAKQFYDISNKLTRQKPVVKFEEGKEFKINSTLKGAIAMQGLAESGKEDLNTLREMVAIGIGGEGLAYVDSQEFTLTDWQTIVETISNAMMGVDDEEEEAATEKKLDGMTL